MIVATGSVPRLDGVQLSNPGETARGMETPTVISSNDLLLDDRRDVGKTAVVIDDSGHYEGLAAAEYLVSRGAAVNFVTRHISVAPRVENTQMVEPALTRLAGKGFTTHLRTRVICVERDGVTVAPTYLPSTTNLTKKLAADTVVFISHNKPLRGLYDLLADRDRTCWCWA